jgi:branched-chain amino acid transport system ATP-binding protein
MRRTVSVDRANPATSREGKSAIDVQALHVAFGGVRALTDITTSVNAREIVAIVGPNGAGKTTLLNAICGLVRKSAGVVLHFGDDITNSTPTKIANGGIGRSFQDPRLVDDATVLQNILTGAHATIGYSIGDQIFRRRKVAQRERAAEAEARELLDLVGLADLADVHADQLAYGPRKMVDILRAAISKPGVLLLDEPSSGLDLAERALVEQTLLRLHRELDLPMLVVEHHLDLVRTVADKVLCLVSGTVAMQGPTTQILDSDEFRATITGEASPRTPEEAIADA